jgi:hypothetical protein
MIKKENRTPNIKQTLQPAADTRIISIKQDHQLIILRWWAL